MKKIASNLISRVSSSEVYRRFAGLSDEDKDKIIERVRAKILESSGDSGKSQPAPQSGSGQVSGQGSGDIVKSPSSSEELYSQISQHLEDNDFEKFLAAQNSGDESQEDGSDESQDSSGAAVDSSQGSPADASASPQQTGEAQPQALSEPDEKTASGIAGDISQVANDNKVPAAKVVELFQGMVGIISNLVSPESNVPTTPVEDKIADKIANEYVASAGIQTVRKDKDLMADTGGESKRPEREPEAKPSREDSTPKKSIGNGLF